MWQSMRVTLPRLRLDKPSYYFYTNRPWSQGPGLHRDFQVAYHRGGRMTGRAVITLPRLSRTFTGIVDRRPINASFYTLALAFYSGPGAELNRCLHQRGGALTLSYRSIMSLSSGEDLRLHLCLRESLGYASSLQTDYVLNTISNELYPVYRKICTLTIDCSFLMW
jgi:hypothetical protein